MTFHGRKDASMKRLIIGLLLGVVVGISATSLASLRMAERLFRSRSSASTSPTRQEHLRPDDELRRRPDLAAGGLGRLRLLRSCFCSCLHVNRRLATGQCYGDLHD